MRIFTTIINIILLQICFLQGSIALEKNISKDYPGAYEQPVFGGEDNIKRVELYKNGLFNQPNKHCLEVGTYEGDTAVYIVENFCNGEGSQLDCIDVWDSTSSDVFAYGGSDGGKKYYENFLKKTDQYIKNKKIIPHKGLSQDVLIRFLYEVKEGKRLKYDFIYIDGSHKSRDVFLDIALAWELLNVGGYILFDDYGQAECTKDMKEEDYHYTAKPAIDGFLASYKNTYELLHKGWQIHLKKISDRP